MDSAQPVVNLKGSKFGEALIQNQVKVRSSEHGNSRGGISEIVSSDKVRSESMNGIRDIQIVFIVGEPGSGKTTQLTPYLCE